jgi:hypothetical protein
MWHPLTELSSGALGWLLLALMVTAVLLFVRLESLGRRLKTGPAPLGIVSFEMAMSGEESRDIIDSWDEQARDDARQNLCLDYFFIPVYTTALAIMGVMSSQWFATKGLTGMSHLAMWLAWGQWIAGLFDFAENSILLRILDMYPTIPDRLPKVAGWCARIKFLLIFLAGLCCAFGLVASLT